MSILWMDIRKVFGLNMRRFRLSTGLSQEAAADLMKLGRAHVSSIERGQGNVTLATVDAVAKVLRCEWADLFDVQAARAFAATSSTLAPRIRRQRGR